MSNQVYNILKNGITLLIFLIFTLFVFTYELHVRHKAESLISQHALVIADSLWNVNLEGAAEYLRLAVVANKYSRLTVYEATGVAFQSVNNEPLTGIEQLFHAVHLTPKLKLSSEVFRNDEVIGKIEAIWLPPTIFTHINVLLVLIFLTITLHLYLRTHRDKSILEDRVRARTRELADSNVSLLREIHEKKLTASILSKSEEEYKKLYEESRNAEEVYRSLINSSADAILICNLEGEVDYLSTTFTELFGWKLEEAKGKRITLSPPEAKTHINDLLQEIRTTGKSYHSYETLGLTRQGQQIDISLSASRFNDHTGSPTGILIVIRDISEQKRLERQLQRSERLEAIGTLAGGIAHDFNNLLMGIQGNTSLAMVELPPDNPIQSRLQAINKYVKNSEQLTAQLLGFARGGKYEVQPTDINKLLREERRLFGRTRKDITFTEELQSNIWTVEVDNGQIRQVLLNLLVNAGQAMPDGGSIHLSTYNTRLSRSTAARYKLEEGPFVQISISDSGHGMEKDTMKRIFDPFFTTKELGRGTGLGLASSYGIIKNHKGFIDVTSDPGLGTTFTIYLPASEKKPPRSRKQKMETDLKHGRGLILLVDDEEMILDVATDILTSLGYEVHTAKTGQEACRMFMDQSDRYIVVILDIIMPDMDGGAVFTRLKEINPEVKVLLSSGYSIEGKASAIMTMGCAGFLQKPFDIKTLSNKLKEII